MSKKVAFVVQRCGLEVNGGAELLCPTENPRGPLDRAPTSLPALTQMKGLSAQVRGALAVAGRNRARS